MTTTNVHDVVPAPLQDPVDIMDELQTNLRRARAIAAGHLGRCISGATGDPTPDEHGDIAGVLDEMLARVAECADALYRHRSVR